MTKQPNSPKPPKGEFKPESQYSEEYIKDRERIDNLAKNVQDQIKQLNKQLQTMQVTEFKFNLAEYNKEQHVKPLPIKKRLWMGLIKVISKPIVWYDKIVTMFKGKPKTS